MSTSDSNGQEENKAPEAPKVRPPGDRRPENDELPLPKKTFLRRRPAGTVVTPQPLYDPYYREPWPRYDENFDDRPKTAHDLYLTYDLKGKLRTHTVYHSPVDPKTIVPRPGKKKKPTEDPETPKT